MGSLGFIGFRVREKGSGLLGFGGVASTPGASSWPRPGSLNPKRPKRPKFPKP